MNKIKAILCMLLGGVLSACAQQENITSVDAAAFQKAITKDSVQLLDVRTAEEYGERHIIYAVNIDVLQPGFKEKAEKVLDPSKLVYVYCRSGKRSMTAATLLAGMGFKVINLKGGILSYPFSSSK